MSSGGLSKPGLERMHEVLAGDLLTFRLGYGIVFARPGTFPIQQAMEELALGQGPPNPSTPPEPDEWIRRLGTLPLLHQPGARWMYHTGSDGRGRRLLDLGLRRDRRLSSPARPSPRITGALVPPPTVRGVGPQRATPRTAHPGAPGGRRSGERGRPRSRHRGGR